MSDVVWAVLVISIAGGLFLMLLVPCLWTLGKLDEFLHRRRGQQ